MPKAWSSWTMVRPKLRIGLIEFVTGEAGEGDFHRMLPPAVMFTPQGFATSIRSPRASTYMEPRLAAAAEQLLPGGRLYDDRFV